MSGHYRTTAKSFELFIDHLKAQGLNLDRVKLQQTKIVLWVVQRANTYHTVKKALQKKERDIEHKWKLREGGKDGAGQREEAGD
jgi:hypothetical protein